MLKRLKILSVVLALSITFCLPQLSAAEKYTANECFEKLSRGTLKFNQGLDKAVFKPIAKGFRALPLPIRTGTSNFVGNLRSLLTFTNNILQGDINGAGNTAGRFAINTTVGILGIFDPASKMGFEKRSREDFGQTLGFWGVSSGPYMILPVFGASNLRDSLGLILDTLLNPLQYLDDSSMKISLFAMEEIDSRSALLALDELVGGDRYLFIREAYSQNREYLVKDGEVEDPFGSF